MERRKILCVLALSLALLLPAGCRGGEESNADETQTDQTVETTDVSADGADLPAATYHSALGYSMTYPVDLIELNNWGYGENYMATDAQGTYLAVSRVEADNISQAVSLVQFEQGVEDDPTGYLFGAEGYAGVRMTQQAGGLTVDFILVEKNGVIFLLEKAVYTGGEELEPTLQTMLDSFTID